MGGAGDSGMAPAPSLLMAVPPAAAPPPAAAGQAPNGGAGGRTGEGDEDIVD